MKEEYTGVDDCKIAPRQLSGILRDPEEPKLTRLTNDLDQLHSEMPDLLRDPSLTEKQYEMLHAAYDRISEAMKIMIDAGRIKND